MACTPAKMAEQPDRVAGQPGEEVAKAASARPERTFDAPHRHTLLLHELPCRHRHSRGEEEPER